MTAAPDTSAIMQHVVDIAAAGPPSFGLADELPALDGDVHAHVRHQLLYASAGALELVTADGRWWLPPERAAWIRGGTEHRVVVRRMASLRTVYLQPDLLPGPDASCRVFQVGPLARHMLHEAMRWGPDHRADPALSAPTVARKAGLSSRTLARRCRAELGISWRQLVQKARLLHAMDRLADPSTTVTEVCYAVGYKSPGTFSSAFRALVGESPRQFQARLGGSQSPSPG